MDRRRRRTAGGNPVRGNKLKREHRPRQREILKREQDIEKTRELMKPTDRRGAERLMLEYAMLALLPPELEQALYSCAKNNAERLFPKWGLFPGLSND